MKAFLSAAVLMLGLSVSAAPASAAGAILPAAASPCGLTGTPPPVTHVIVVMMENESYDQVIGAPADPYQNALAAQCGSGTEDFGATHTSASNYLAVSGGQFPPSSTGGCNFAACSSSEPSIYGQLDAAGLTWDAFIEAMPLNCDKSSNNGSGGNYKIGHNPVLFYTGIPHAECTARDIAEPSLTVASGALYAALQAGTLPSFTWITPSLANENDGTGGNLRPGAADLWLSRLVPLITGSPSYAAGGTLLLITYDEGNLHASDYAPGENCPVTLGASCHVPLLVVYPYTPAGTQDPAVFDHYSVTKTIEGLFGLPLLAHAADAGTASLQGHFGIAGG